MSRSNESAGRRLRIITLDQIVAGASNVLTAVLAARMLDTASFGLFGIVFLVYVTAQGVSRALVCGPLLVHPVEARERPGDAIGTATSLGLALGALVVVGALVTRIWHADLATSLLALGLCLPLLVLQDLGRYLGFAIQRPAFSLGLDLLWLGLLVVGLAALLATDRESLVWFITLWAASGAAAGVLVLVRFGVRAPRPSLTWLRETWMFSWRYLVSYLATQGGALAASVGLVAIAGARTLGAVSAAQLLQRPVGLFQAASVAAGTSEISNLGPRRDEARRHVRRTTVLTTLVAVANLVVLVLLPDQLGRLALGDSWGPAEPLLLPASIQMVMLALTSGTKASLTGRREVRTTLRIDIVSVLVLIALPLVGVAMDGARGAYWAFALGQAVVALIWWLAYARHESRAPEPAPYTEPDAAADAAADSAADSGSRVELGPAAG